VAAGVDILVHLPFNSVGVDKEVVDMLAERATPVIATMHVRSPGSCAHSPGRFLDGDDPVGERLDRRQRRDAAERPEVCELLTDKGIAKSRTFPEASLFALHRAGVPILVGTDLEFPGVVAGLGMYTEMQLLAEGGMPTEEILAGATSRTADAFGLDERGRITPGKRGDMVLLDAAEPDDVIGTYAVEAVWKNGHAVDLTPPN
jgi:imidazolonepropionase-like amidohydrolase